MCVELLYTFYFHSIERHLTFPQTIYTFITSYFTGSKLEECHSSRNRYIKNDHLNHCTTELKSSYPLSIYKIYISTSKQYVYVM